MAFLGVDQPKNTLSDRKVPLAQGCSLMDWIRLCSRTKDMAGTNGKILKVTDDQMASHSSESDAWMIIHGKVYNVTAYLAFHPGGREQLLRAIGSDGTSLFAQYHAWVNYESLLKSCFVGVFVGSRAKLREPRDYPLPIVSVQNLRINEGVHGASTKEDFDIRQQFDDQGRIVELVVALNSSALQSCYVFVQVEPMQLGITMRRNKQSVLHKWLLTQEVMPSLTEVLYTENSPTQFIVRLTKRHEQERWTTFGAHSMLVRTAGDILAPRCFILKNIRPVTHDTNLYIVALPSGCFVWIPTGYHVYLERIVAEVAIRRPYTPVIDDLHGTPVEFVQSVKLLIKLYRNGVLTKQLADVNPGDVMSIVDGDGSFVLPDMNRYKSVLLLAAGTGITPMIKLIVHLVRSSEIIVKLVFFNKTQRDMIWREKLEELARDCYRFSVHFVLSQPDATWSGMVGMVNAAMLKALDISVSLNDCFVCVCGPQPFTDLSIQLLHECGCASENIHSFSG